MFTGFPWALLSYAFVGTPFDVWLAWIGPYGLTGAIALVSACCAAALVKSDSKLMAAPVMVLLLTGLLLLVTPQAIPATDGPTVRLVQPNAQQNQKWDPEWMPVFFNRALEFTAQTPDVDAVIWPETSIPNILHYSDTLISHMSQAARGAPVIAGVQREANGDYFNSLIVIAGPQEISQIYDKSHLVPFGEYIPFADILRPLGLSVLVDQIGGFEPGRRSSVIEVPKLGRVRALICYEGIFPEEIQGSGPRPDLLMILTNDAWFGTGAGPRQHLVQAQARAIEQGLPLVRSANTGISALIDGRGRIVDQLALNTAGALDVAVPPPLPQTLYSRIGDWPLALLLLFGGLRAVVARKRFAVDRGGSGA